MSPTPQASDRALDKVGRALDAVDVHTEAMSVLHDALSTGFFALSREQASSHTAALQLSSALFDQRASVAASLCVQYQDTGRLALLDTRLEETGTGEPESSRTTGLRRRKHDGAKPVTGATRKMMSGKSGVPAPRHSIHAMPSAALREAAESFERAVTAAVAVANAAAEVDERMAKVPMQ